VEYPCIFELIVLIRANYWPQHQIFSIGTHTMPTGVFRSAIIVLIFTCAAVAFTDVTLLGVSPNGAAQPGPGLSGNRT
jgi:hypothetical protein